MKKQALRARIADLEHQLDLRTKERDRAEEKLVLIRDYVAEVFPYCRFVNSR